MQTLPTLSFWYMENGYNTSIHFILFIFLVSILDRKPQEKLSPIGKPRFQVRKEDEVF